MPKREKAVKAWALVRGESLAKNQWGLCYIYSTQAAAEKDLWNIQLDESIQPVQIIVPKPAKKAAKKPAIHDEGPPFGFFIPPSKTAKKRRSRK